MNTFEQKIADTVNKKLSDGTVEELVEKYIEKGVSDALDDLFRYGGDAKKLIEEKLKDVLVPVIERHDFNRYLVKLDSVLTEIVNSTVIADNKKILENFKELMKDRAMEEIRLSDIFKRYCEHVAKNVNTYDLEAFCDDGDPYYEYVSAEMEVEHKDKGWLSSDYDECIVKFICGNDKDLNCQVRLYKGENDEVWELRGCRDSIDINSLRGLSNFEVFLMTLMRGFVNIIMDEESAYDDEIEPEEKPEWTLE